MQIHSRERSRAGNRVVIAQGALALLAFTMMLGVAARGIQSQPEVQAQESLLQSSVPVSGQADSMSDAADASAGVFTGTIVKDGNQLVFRDQSGKVFRLNKEAKARDFEGKPVQVKGRLEETTGLLHVDSIEALPA